MRKYYLFVLLTTISLVASAQTQYGVVKTRGRMVNGVLQPGKGLADATVKVAGRQPVVSQGNEGSFSFPVAGQNFRIESVQKKDYQLVDMSVCTEYKYSENPLRLVMETPEQQQSDLLAAEKKIRSNLRRQLQEREDEIEALKVSQQEKDSLLRVLYQQQGDNEKLIADMARRYSTLDYDQLDEFYRQVSWFIENGELTRADSLLRTRGDINIQVQDILKQGAAIQDQKQKLQKAETVYQADVDEAARRCYGYFETFKAQHQNDSAAYYLELRVSLDTTNFEYIYDYIKYASQQRHFDKAESYCFKLMKIQDSKLLEDSLSLIGKSTVYNTLSIIYSQTNRIEEGINACRKAIEIQSQVAENYPFIIGSHARTLCNLSKLFMSLRKPNYEESKKALLKAKDIFKQLYEIDSFYYQQDYTKCLNALGYTYSCLEEYSKAKNFLHDAIDIIKKSTIDNMDEERVLASSELFLGIVYDKNNEFPEAEKRFQEAIDIYSKLYTQNPDANVREYFSALSTFGMFFRRNNPEKAKDFLYQAIKILEPYSQKYPTIYTELASSLNELGTIYLEQGHLEESQTLLENALKINRQNSYRSLSTTISLSNLSIIYTAIEDYTRAEEVLKEAIAINKELYKEKPNMELANYLYGLGSIYFNNNSGNFSKSEELLSEAYDICQSEYDPNNSRHKVIFFNTLQLLLQVATYNANYSKAYSIAQTLISLMREELKDRIGFNLNSKEVIINNYINASFVSIMMKKYHEAEQYAREGLAIDSTKYLIYSNLAPALLFQGKYEEAEQIYYQYKEKLKDSFLDDFKQFSDAGVIPKEREADVERIKRLIEE